ncbi:MAG TPA: CO dehydrogenase/CO-methylating acetyl-CoA synthase complex subunit beta, partial [Anaerolineae bacterium]|nr:CO dehydrogenase/CO-methylating acetyl-CoA synthase complex subunit beta [Anaerolineae bacterium]
MSRYIATRALRGANLIVQEFEALLNKALQEFGADKKVEFTNTAYFLPTVLGYTGMKVETIGGLKPVLEHCKTLLHTPPPGKTWLPYLGETLDAGVATLLAEEGVMALRFVYGQEPQKMPGLELTGTSAPGNGYLNGPIDDIQLRSWGIQLVDGRMPGFAAIIGAARTNQAAVELVRQLQQRNILIFLSGNVNGRSIIHQLMEEGVEMGYDTYIVP